MPQGYEYFAFLSYSHRDDKLVAKLHRQLETFTVPKALAEANALEHRRVFPIFRDRDETSASSNLSDTVQAALEASHFLVVACSASAFGSQWVNAEVQSFIDMGRSDRIICVILDDAANIPAALKDQEPLAADLRADGWKNAKLKVLAALLGCRFDDLKQRDLQRTQRRLVLTAAASIAGLVFTSGLAAYALMAEREASAQRELAQFHLSKAEDLVSYMLGDLRDSLEPIGRLDVLDSVGDEVMNYFSSLPTAEVDTSLAIKQSLALRQVGEIRLQQGRLDEGMAALLSSMAGLEAVLPGNESDPDLIFEISQLQFWIADVHLRKGEFDLAEERIQRYLDYSIALRALDSANPDYRMEVAWAYSNKGALAQRRGDLGEATRLFTSAYEVQEALVSDYPAVMEYQSELAHTTSWLASQEYSRGALASALTLYQRELALHRSIAAVSDDSRHLIVQARSHGWIAQTLAAMGRYEDAAPVAQEALSYFTGAVSHDPDNLDWALEYYAHICQQARNQIWSGRYQEASANLRSVRYAMSSAAVTDSVTAGLLLQAEVATTFAYLHWLLGDEAEARVEAAGAVDSLRQLVEEASDTRVLSVYGDAAYILSEVTRSRSVAREALMVVGQHEGESIEVGARRFLLAVSAGQDELAQQYGLQLADTEFSVPTVPESSAEELWNSLAQNRGP